MQLTKWVLLIALYSLGACSLEESSAVSDMVLHKQVTTSKTESENAIVKSVKFAQFNVSFALDGDPSESYHQWVEFMSLPRNEQEALLQGWRGLYLDEDKKRLAERVMQIRNIAAIIQHVRPDVLLLNEFNNDGTGEDYAALQGFQQNYLAHPQSLNSIDGGSLQSAIHYPYVQNYATNTGLNAGLDLNNNGFDEADPNDAYGFGFYHGHYAFALLSKYEIDTGNTRTFQTFKRKDLPDAIMPLVNVCDGERPLPNNMSCGDNWFSELQWNVLRLSSKNHVDVPIKIPSASGIKTIHALLSHPTPPAFDTFSDNNKYRNSEENLFWLRYIQGANYIVDDLGKIGGLDAESFVIMGDLNADAQIRTALDPRFNGITQLMSAPEVNQDVAQASGKYAPLSKGGEQAPLTRPHPTPAIRTSTFGARADYAVPSSDLEVIDSGVFWKAEGEVGRLLFNDPRIGERGADKEVSSDHRLVWVSIAIH